MNIFGTCVNRMIACHQGTSAGCANWVNVVVLQDDAAIGQSVNVWCRNLVGAMKADIIPTLKRHLRDPCGLCIVLRFEISYFPPRCVAHEEEKQQPYSEAGEMEQYQIFLPIKMNN